MQCSIILRQNTFFKFCPRFCHQALLYSSRSASDQLFADAEREESEGHSSSTAVKSSSLNNLKQHENWTGDESIQDAVLRMLVDKYKPLRGPNIMSAEEKLKRTPPKVTSVPISDVDSANVSTCTGSTSQTFSFKPRSGSWATEPLLPSSPTHKPWETTFKAPSEGAVPNIKMAQSSPLTSGSGGYGAAGGSNNLGQGNLDERLVRKERERMKKVQQVGRLSQALDSTLDYRLGIKTGQQKQAMRAGKPNPVSVKGWNSLVEERIESGLKGLKDLKGRGKPLVRSTDESNPFIAREEFLMNRIVQRNGAAPPWIDVQGELDTAVTTFRELLRQSWVRRALRILKTDNPPELLYKVTLDQVKGLRDPDWVRKEQSYHETAVAELNSLVRKYNGLAPYTARRPYYYSRETEIERMYDTSAEDIMRELHERLRDSGSGGRIGSAGSFTRSTGSPRGTAGLDTGAGSTLANVEQDHPPASWRFRDLIREWFNDKMSSRSRTSR